MSYQKDDYDVKVHPKIYKLSVAFGESIKEIKPDFPQLLTALVAIQTTVLEVYAPNDLEFVRGLLDKQKTLILNQLSKAGFK